MSDIDGAAAPADSSSAPVIAETPNPVATEAQGHPEPVKTEPKAEVKAEPEAKKPISTRDALLKAAEKVEKDNPSVKSEAKTEAKTEPKDDKAKAVASDPVKRDETGKFAPKGDAKADDTPAVRTDTAKPSHTAGEPPARFSQDAKTAWATAPESVRAEVSRMERELTQGFEKHRSAAERDASLNEFHEMAQKSGTDVKTALSRYVGMETMLRQNPLKGLEEICSNVGISLRDVAAHVLGQTPEQNASAQDATVRELRQQNQTLEARLNKIEGGFQQQRETATRTDVEKFAATNPRFEELADDIAFFLKTRTNDLSEAYKLAERLNPAPAQASSAEPAASSAPVIDLAAQTAKGQKSIQGSPTPGSDPVKRQPSNSIKDSLRKAMAAAG